MTHIVDSSGQVKESQNKIFGVTPVDGDTFYIDHTSAFARLAIGAAGYVYKVVTGFPAWAQIAFSELTGALGTGQHGTLSDGDHSGNMTGNARVAVARNGADVGTRRKVNLIEGTAITLSVADNAGAERVDVTINSSGGSGSELLMQDGVTAPPVPIENEAQDDWLYAG